MVETSGPYNPLPSVFYRTCEEVSSLGGRAGGRFVPDITLPGLIRQERLLTPPEIATGAHDFFVADEYIPRVEISDLWQRFATNRDEVSQSPDPLLERQILVETFAQTCTQIINMQHLPENPRGSLVRYTAAFFAICNSMKDQNWHTPFTEVANTLTEYFNGCGFEGISPQRISHWLDRAGVCLHAKNIYTSHFSQPAEHHKKLQVPGFGRADSASEAAMYQMIGELLGIADLRPQFKVGSYRVDMCFPGSYENHWRYRFLEYHPARLLPPPSGDFATTEAYFQFMKQYKTLAVPERTEFLAQTKATLTHNYYLKRQAQLQEAAPNQIFELYVATDPLEVKRALQAILHPPKEFASTTGYKNNKDDVTKTGAPSNDNITNMPKTIVVNSELLSIPKSTTAERIRETLWDDNLFIQRFLQLERHYRKLARRGKYSNRIGRTLQGVQI